MNPASLARPRPPGRRASIALAVAVHVLLAAFLIYGFQWQSRPPETIEVELIRALPAPAVAPAPVMARPKPKPEPQPEPRPEPKPLPPPPKPEIAVKEKEKPKLEKPKLEQPKPPPKEEPKPRPDPFQEALKRETEQLAQRKAAAAFDEEIAQARTAQAASTRAKGVADYISKVRAKIRGNVVLPPDLKGNPEAIFDVTQLPSGEILTVKLRKSSGNAALDAAFERAILKSSPLPKPEQGELFSRTLELRHRPFEE